MFQLQINMWIAFKLVSLLYWHWDVVSGDLVYEKRVKLITGYKFV